MCTCMYTSVYIAGIKSVQACYCTPPHIGLFKVASLEKHALQAQLLTELLTLSSANLNTEVSHYLPLWKVPFLRKPMFSCWLVQVVTVWLQYMSILGNVNIPAPGTVHWVFSVASFAFSSITSGSLSLDCLIRAGPLRPALKRLLVHLAVPVINLLLLSAWQFLW